MKIVQFTVVVILLGLFVLPVYADWDSGDGHKMHYSQMPDPNGWDVNVTFDTMYDDWQCSGTGPVSDVHFWVSWKGGLSSNIISIDLKIWSDTPANPDDPQSYSHPNEQLWATQLAPGDWTVRMPPQTGVQGWFDPQPPDAQLVITQDHTDYYQINVDEIEEPWQQTEGEIYWLGIHIGVSNTDTQIGWKTTLNPWNDDAAHYYGGEWHEMFDPGGSGESLNMAFVITPEPASLCALALGGLCLLSRRKR